MVRDGVIFLCGIPGIQRMGTSLWWVPMTGESVVSMCLSDDGGSRWTLRTALSFAMKSLLTDFFSLMTPLYRYCHPAM
ncbi:unnamed protein product [Staurois parvus]|uniref:Uncharacterized protein n=1 Tax=Staurois parvus TaxID=386267 RepID=A0ABN9GNP4_9NEOB|nr:unnamed protein product [Staurois parvus]